MPRLLRTALMSASALALSVGIVSPAMAQASTEPSNPAAPARTAEQIDDNDIVVTASKSGSTALARTAVTANVVGSEALQDRKIASVSDLQTQVPGLIADSGSSSPKVSIRGVGHDLFGISAENGVATYIDGVLVGRTQGLLSPYNDLSQVEVLKGPQGTSFGRNAVGGAINYITQKPTPGFGGFADLQYGSFDRKRAGGALNYGGDRFGARISGYYQKDDGFARNLFTGRRGEGDRQYTFRAIADFQPVDDLKFEYLFDYANSRYHGPAEAVVGDPSLTAVAAIANALRNAGVPVPDPYTAVANDDYTFVNNLEPLSRTSVMTNALTTTLDIGDLTLRSITAFQRTRYSIILDTDISALPILETPLTSNAGDQFTQELVGTVDIGRLTLTLGGYYLREKAVNDAEINFFASVDPAGLIVDFDTRQITRSYAGFAEGKFKITDSFRATAGVRYTHDEKDVDLFSTGTTSPLAPPQATFPICDTSVSNSWSKATFNAGLEADLSSTTFGYGKVSRGFKAGGFNDAGCPNTYDPETLTSYEIGLKGSLFDRRVRYALSAFYSKYDDIQVSVIRVLGGAQTSSQTENAAKATIWGFDAQGSADLGGGFSFDVAASYIPTASYDAYFSVDPFNVAGGTQDLSGNRLNRAPKLTGTVGLNFQQSLGNERDLTLRGELYHTSKIEYAQFQYPTSTEPGYTLLNAYLAVDLTPDFSVRLFGKNLTDKFYLAGRVPNAAIFQTLGYYGRPREFGVELTYQFGRR